MRRGGWVVGAGRALTLVLVLALAGCGGDEPPGNGTGYAAPADDFCGDLVDTAIPRPGQGVTDPWMAGGYVDGEGEGDDDLATTATCTFTGGHHRIAVVVRVGDGAEASYDEAVAELESGAVGFESPETAPLDGWWTAGRRFEPARAPVRVADVLWGDDAFARVEVVEYGGRRGRSGPRRAAAVDLTEAVTTAVPEVLGRE
jgi:hypothetical protein